MEFEALTNWVKSCSTINGVKDEIAISLSEGVYIWNYKDLCNGILLNAILIYIDQRSGKLFRLSEYSNDISSRLRNLRTVMRNMRSYYCEVLQQLVVMPLPDLLSIARQPFPEGSGEEMKKVLLLLLGCAVQSDKKEEFINKIKELDLSLQQAIVEQIRKVTNDVDCVLNVQALELDPDDKATTVVLHQLQRVIKERDCYAQTVLDLNQEQESDASSTQSVCNGDLCSRKLPECQQHVQYSSDTRETSVEKHHSVVELAELKAKCRRQKQDLDLALDEKAMYKEEIEEKDVIIAKLRQENLDLMKDARAAKDYRDENDVLRDKADKLERVELECSKYKEKLSELEFLKSRNQELRDENHVLLENRNMLSDQCESYRRRLTQIGNVETEYVQCQRVLSDLQQQLKIDQEKIVQLVDDNARLEKECQESLNKSANLEKELDFVRNNVCVSPRASLVPLADQLNESAHSKMLKLEMENQKLRAQVETCSPDSSAASLELCEELKQENDKLRKKIDYLQEQNMKSSNLCLDLQDERETFVRQRQEFERTFGSLEENFKRETEELLNENKKLLDELAQVKAKLADVQLDDQKQEIEELEMKLESVKGERDELKSRKADISTENRNLTQEICRLKAELTRTQDRVLDNEKEKLDCENRVYAFDREKRCLEKENIKLKQTLESSEAELENVRTLVADLSREKQKMEQAQTKFDETVTSLTELEVDKKHLAQQLDMEQKKMSALREDLVKEKTRVHEMEIKIQSIFTCLDLPTSPSTDDQLQKVDSAVQTFVEKLKCEVEEYQSKYQQTNFDKNQLVEHLQNRDKDLEAMKEKLLTVETDRSKALIKELEQRNVETSEENKNVKQQVYILQEQIRKMQTTLDGAAREKCMLQQEIKDLQLQMSSNNAAQSDNAKMQVELRALQLQVTVLEQDNVELEKQCGQWERDHMALRRDFEHLHAQYGSLLGDHEQLQMLHEQLSTDFEKLQCELGQLKSQTRQVRHECLEHSEQLDRVRYENQALHELKSKWDQERAAKEREFKSFAIMQNEHGSLKKSYDELNARYEFLTNDMDTVRMEYKNLRADYNNVNLRATQLQGQLADCHELVQRKDLEVVKLLHKCDMLTQLNGTLEEESRTLLRQMDMLIAQNQDLLTQALMDKEHYHAEEKELQEKLNALKRHKEKLEEKIMDQYKVMESPSKRKEKTNFIKKARAALTPKTSVKKVKSRNMDIVDDNYMSADEGGFSSPGSLDHSIGYKNGISTPLRAFSAERPQALFRNADTKSSNSTSLETLQNVGLQSPEVSHKRSHSSSTQPESNLSSNGSSSGTHPSDTTSVKCRPSHLSPNSIVIDRISLAGSERAVDVPTDNLSPKPIGAKLPPPYPPPRQTIRMNGPPPPPRIPAQPRTVPPRYGPPQGLPPTSPPMVRNGGSVNKPRPPPPPYQKVAAYGKAPPPLPTSSSSSSSVGSPRDLSRFRPDLAATTENNDAQSTNRFSNGSDQFAPQQTSTPRSEQSFVFSSPPSTAPPLHPGNNSAVQSSNSSEYDSVPIFRNSSSTKYAPDNVKRKDIVSFYENIENLPCAVTKKNVAPLRDADVTLTSDVIPDANVERDSSIWFEYGCV